MCVYASDVAAGTSSIKPVHISSFTDHRLSSPPPSLLATTTADGVLEGGGDTFPTTSSNGNGSGVRDKLGAFYRFTRPHTIRGTILASAMGVLRCLIEHPKALTLQPVPRALLVGGWMYVFTLRRACACVCLPIPTWMGME